MSWGDSYCIAFTQQAEAGSRADHPGEKVALSDTTTHSRRFGRPVQVGSFRLRISGSLRRTVPQLPIASNPYGVQWVRGVRSAVLSIAGR